MVKQRQAQRGLADNCHTFRSREIACAGQTAPATSKPQSTDGVALNHGQVDLVSKQVTDVVNAVQNHGGPLLYCKHTGGGASTEWLYGW